MGVPDVPPDAVLGGAALGAVVLGDGITPPGAPHAPKRSVGAEAGMLGSQAVGSESRTHTQRGLHFWFRGGAVHARAQLPGPLDGVLEVLGTEVLRHVARDHKLTSVETSRDVIRLPTL